MPPVSTTPVTTYTLQYLVKGQASFVQAALSTQRAQDQMARSTRDLNTQQERLTTRLQATQVAITGLIQRELSLTRSINDHTAALGKLMPEYQKRFAQLGALYTRLSAATTAGNANQVRLISGQINKLAATYGPLFLEVENLNKALDKERSKLAATSAELGNKRSQMRKLTDAMDDLPVLLNESAEGAERMDEALQNQSSSTQQATASQFGFNQSVARGLLEFERFNHMGSRVVRTLEALYRGTTGKSLLGVFGTGGAATATLLKFAGVALAVTAGIALIGGAIFAISKGVQFLGNAFRDAVQAGADLAGQGLQAIVNVGSQVITTFAGIAQEALLVVAGYEKFVLSSRALLAVSLVQTGQFGSVRDAMGEAAKQAGQLLKWMIRLGIESPFSIQDVREVMQFSQAMGFNESQARRLTTALIDWGSAMGVGGDEMRRVALALGQMSRLGRISSQDVMQLAQVFIDFDGTVARAMEKTPQEIRKMREEGILPVQEALNSLVTQLEVDFKGAAKEQAKSIRGLIESLGDLRDIYLREFFGPIDEKTLKVGGAIGFLQEKMIELVDVLQDPIILGAVKSFGTQFELLARNAYTWGQNVAINFANGIMAGAIYIVRALTNIGNVMAYWLESHSPPRLLPDIDKWGMSTLLAWLKGFTLPNINLFGELSSTLSSVLQSLVIDPSDKGGKLGIIERIFGTREAIGSVINQAMKLGSITDSMVNSVTAAMGSSTAEVAAYVRSMLELELQNRKVTAAQDELNRVTKYYEELLKPIEDELKAIDDAQLALLGGIRTTHLELILGDPNATLEEKELARLEIAKIVAEKKKRLIEAEAKVEIDKAQTVLDAEMEKQKFLEDQAELQRKLLDQQIEQNRLLQQYLDIIESLKEKASKGGGAETTLNDPFGFLGAGPLEGAKKAKAAKDNFLLNFFKPLLGALESLKQTWARVWAAIEERLVPLKAAWETLKTSFTGLVTAIKEDIPTLQAIFGVTWAEIIADTIIFGIVMLRIVNAMVVSLRKLWEEHGVDIAIWAAVVFKLIVQLTYVTIILIAAWMLGVLEIIRHTLNLISIDWRTVFMSLPLLAQAYLISVWTTVTMWLGLILAKFQTILADILTEVGKKFGEVRAKVEEKMKEIVDWFKNPDRDWAQLGRTFVQGIIDGIGSMAGSLFQKVRTLIGDVFATAQAAEESASPSKRAMRELGLPIAQGMAMGILKGAPLVAGARAMMVGASVSPPASGNQIANSSTINNSHTDHWSLNVNSTRNSDNIIHDFAIMQAMTGA